MAGVPRSQVLLAWRCASDGSNSPGLIVPDGYVVLVKSLYIWNGASQAADIWWSIGINGQWNFTASQNTIASAEIYRWDGWIVMNPGHITYFTSQRTGVIFWLSGAYLAGPPQFPLAATQLDLPTQLPLPGAG